MDSHQRGTFRPCELNTWELHTRGYVQSVHRDLAVLMMPQGHLTRGHFGVDVDQLYLLPASEDTSGLNGGFGVIKWNCQTQNCSMCTNVPLCLDIQQHLKNLYMLFAMNILMWKNRALPQLLSKMWQFLD